MNYFSDDRNLLIKTKQTLFLEKIQLPLNEKIKVFVNSSTLKLTSFGVKQAKEIKLDFTELKYETPLTIREIKELCFLNREIFYISSDQKTVFIQDQALAALYSVFKDNRQAYL